MERAKVVEIYGTLGAKAAVEASGISKRTIQRWAREAGVSSGFNPEDRKIGCPSTAEYLRGCRCEGCKAAHRKTQKEAKQRRVEKYRSGERKIRSHGVSGYSNWECRCEVCRAAWSRYLKERRAMAKRRAAEMQGDNPAAEFIAKLVGNQQQGSS